MKRLIPFVVLLTLSLSPLAVSAGNIDIIISQVDNLMDEGDARKALKYLDSMIKENPGEADLLAKRADIMHFFGRTKEAQEAVDAVMAIDTQNCLAIYIQAYIHADAEQTDSTIWYCNQAMAYEPEYHIEGRIHELQGRTLMLQGDFKAAEDHLHEAAGHPSATPQTMQDLAWTLFELHKTSAAIAVLDESLDIFGETVEALVNIGYLCNKVKRYEQGTTYLEKAYELDRHNPFVLTNLAESYLRTDGLGKAFKLIEESLKNDRSNPYSHRIRGECLAEMNEPDRACRAYRKARDLGYTELYEADDLNELVIASCDLE